MQRPTSASAAFLHWHFRCQFALGSGKQFTNRVILMTEPVANILKDKYKTIGQLEDALIDTSRRPAYERAFANYYANAGGRKDGEGMYIQQDYHSNGQSDTQKRLYR